PGGAAGAAGGLPDDVSRPGRAHDLPDLWRADPRLPGTSGAAEARPAPRRVGGRARGQLRPELPVRRAAAGPCGAAPRLPARYHERADAVAAVDIPRPGDPGGGRLLWTGRPVRRTLLGGIVLSAVLRQDRGPRLVQRRHSHLGHPRSVRGARSRLL